MHSYMWENNLIFPRKSNGIRERSPEFINKGFMDLGKSWAMESEWTIVEHMRIANMKFEWYAKYYLKFIQI